MTERKDLKRFRYNEYNELVEDANGSWIDADEAYAVIDGFEERIEKFERRIQAYKELHDECVAHLMAIHWAFGHGELDKYIKDFETKWLGFKNDKDKHIKELRYERTMWKALMFENLAAIHSWQGHDPRIDSAEAWKECHDYNRCMRIAKALKTRAKKLKEDK